MNRPGHSNEKVEARIHELETKFGVEKKSDPRYEKLTPLMWLYTLEVVVEGWLPNRTAYAKEYDCSRQTLYGFDGHPKVVEAVRVLSKSKNSIRIHGVEDLVFKQAGEGCLRSQKLLLERYPPATDDHDEQGRDEAPTWDFSLGKPQPTQPPEPKDDDTEPQPN